MMPVFARSPGVRWQLAQAAYDRGGVSAALADQTFKLRHDEFLTVLSLRGQIFHLDAVGAVIWEALAEDRNTAQIAQIVGAVFRVEQSRAERDVSQFLDLMVNAGLLQSRRPPAD